ncbi:M81 family metallopeptidase [Cyclobacterium amurskyense]|uniref:M81 family metallopeptidase n=1 Tax=Cyclobacterium amurskyense TaxID=320787 RepID=UPI0030D98064|tara:strand:+ start:250 stop:1827 length:1578 start_codon:yes stop_codon:yes gene_type:complete
MKKSTILRITIVLPLVLFSFLTTYAQKKPIIGVAGIAHESNSFSSQLTTLDKFDFQVGESQKELATKFFSFANSQTISSGYIEGAKRFGLELYPTVVTRARPMGPLTDNAFNTIMDEIIKQLKAGPKLDGILLNLHGAMVVESYPSGDEEIVRRVRKAFGPKMPIIVTHDFHANVTPELVKLSNVLITFKENPHLDTFDRGMQAAKIMAEMVKEGVKPTQAIVKAPMVYNIVYQSTFSNPLLPITTESKELEKNEKILAVSVSGGYQYADVPWMGPSVIVVTDNDPELAQKEAQKLSDKLWNTRHETVLDSPQPEEAVKMAMEHEGRPVVLIDMGDNIGGGSTGDSSFLLEELLKQGAEGWVVVIADPEAYKVAEKAGIGNDFDFEVGGKTDELHGKPVRIKGQVRSLNVGKYLETEVRHGGGRYWNMGHTGVIQVEGSTLDEPNLVLLTTLASSPNSAHQLISNGVYVERQKIIVVKGNIAPRAAYEPFASKLIQVDSPGATAVNPSWFTFKRARKGMFGMGDY